MELPWYQQQVLYLPKQDERLPHPFGEEPKPGEQDELAEGGGRPARDAG